MSTHEDDDEDLSRQATVLANAEELSREHSARREVKLREERVRRLASPPKEETSRRRAKEESRRRSSPKKPRPKPGPGVDDPLHSNVSEGSSGDEITGSGSNPRLSDPFPPIRKKGQGSSPNRSTPDLPARRGSSSSPQAPADPGPDRPSPGHSGPYRAIGPRSSSSDLMAMELEELMRRFRMGWRRLGGGDKIAVLSSLMVMAGTLMPWVSLPGRPLEVGIFIGGLVHLMLSVASLRFVVMGFANEFEFSAAELQRRRARHSLYIVLLGALSTFFGAYLLLMWGSQKSADYPIVFHFGLYWTLACGTGVSYGGFARFGAGGPNE